MDAHLPLPEYPPDLVTEGNTEIYSKHDWNFISEISHVILDNNLSAISQEYLNSKVNFDLKN